MQIKPEIRTHDLQGCDDEIDRRAIGERLETLGLYTIIFAQRLNGDAAVLPFPNRHMAVLGDRGRKGNPRIFEKVIGEISAAASEAYPRRSFGAGVHGAGKKTVARSSQRYQA